MTVSAVARLMPRPPARVDNRKQNAGDPTAATQHTTIVNTSDLTAISTWTWIGKLPPGFIHPRVLQLYLWGKLEETTRASSYHVAEHRPAWPESLQPHTEWSSRPGPEPSYVKADVYVWRYALLVVHATKEEEESLRTNSLQAGCPLWMW